MTSSPETMGIYVHIPFCRRKCSYCDFYSLPIIDPDLFDKYSSCLVRELSRRASEYRFPFASIYLGGGTPSLLEPWQIERIIDAVHRYCMPADDLEITIEVNPATVNRQKLEDLRLAGINRLSIGVQSFVDRELIVLGRMHDSSQARQCIDWAYKAGFTNVNVDLIYGTPGQQLSDWLGNLTQAADSGAQHISAYLLQLESNVPLAGEIQAGSLAMLADDEESDLYYMGRDLLLNLGFEHYELSNYARPGRQCRHNLTYWRVQPYLGIGVGAVSFDGRQRIINLPPLQDYLAALAHEAIPPTKILETIDARQARNEAFIMGLRLTEGVDRIAYQDRFGMDPLEAYQTTVDRFKSQGLLTVDDHRIALSPRAYFVSNAILSEFVE